MRLGRGLLLQAEELGLYPAGQGMGEERDDTISLNWLRDALPGAGWGLPAQDEL